MYLNFGLIWLICPTPSPTFFFFWEKEKKSELKRTEVFISVFGFACIK